MVDIKTESFELQKKIKSIQKKIVDTSTKLSSLKEELRITIGETPVICEANYAIGLNPGREACGKISLIRDLIYIQTNYVAYDDPYCGLQWASGEGQFDCPHCGYRNRLYTRDEIQKLSRSFRKIVETYKDQ